MWDESLKILFPAQLSALVWFGLCPAGCRCFASDFTSALATELLGSGATTDLATLPGYILALLCTQACCSCFPSNLACLCWVKLPRPLGRIFPGEFLPPIYKREADGTKRILGRESSGMAVGLSAQFANGSDLKGLERASGRISRLRVSGSSKALREPLAPGLKTG